MELVQELWDGTNLRTTYGIALICSGYKELLCLPDGNDPLVNRWYERDGAEVLFTTPRLKPFKSVSLPFVAFGGEEKISAFRASLSLRQWHTLASPLIPGGSVRLGAVEGTQFTHRGAHFIEFTLKCKAFVPPIEEAKPQTAEPISDNPIACRIDGTEIAYIGATLLDGSYESLSAFPPYKENPLAAPYRKQAAFTAQSDLKESRIKVLLRASSPEALLANRHELLRLVARGVLTIDIAGRTFHAFYRSASVDDYEFDRTLAPKPYIRYTLILYVL